MEQERQTWRVEPEMIRGRREPQPQGTIAAHTYFAGFPGMDIVKKKSRA